MVLAHGNIQLIFWNEWLIDQWLLIGDMAEQISGTIPWDPLFTYFGSLASLLCVLISCSFICMGSLCLWVSVNSHQFYITEVIRPKLGTKHGDP